MGTVYDSTRLESSAELQSGPQSSQTASASIIRAKCDNYSIQPAASDIENPDHLHIMDQEEQVLYFYLIMEARPVFRTPHFYTKMRQRKMSDTCASLMTRHHSYLKLLYVKQSTL